MITKINKVLEEEQYVTKTVTDNSVRINTTSPEAYRELANCERDKYET